MTLEAIEAWDAQEEERQQLGRDTRERWADDLRPRRSELAEALLGVRPVTVVDHGTYKVTYQEPCYVLFEFDYLTHSRSTGGIGAEVAVLVDGGVGKGHYQRTHLNLLADRSVASFAKSLSERLPELKVPCAQYLNDAAQWVIAEYRTGEPAILLRDAPAPASGSAPLVPPILAADGSTILFGDGGSAKSYLALGLAASLHSGRELIEGMAPSSPRRVGFLDWEWSGHVHRRRLERLGPTRSCPNWCMCRVAFRSARNATGSAASSATTTSSTSSSIRSAWPPGVSPSPAEVAVQFFAVLRELGLDALLVAHVTKQDARGTADRPFGSAYWHELGSVDVVRQGQPVKPDGTDAGPLSPQGQRPPNWPPRSASASRSAAMGQRSPAPTWPTCRTSLPSIPVRARMIELLRGGSMPLHEIADRLDVGLDAVRWPRIEAKGRSLSASPAPMGSTDGGC